MKLTVKSAREFKDYVIEKSGLPDVFVDVAWQEPFTLTIERMDKIEKVNYIIHFSDQNERLLTFDKNEVDRICSNL